MKDKETKVERTFEEYCRGINGWGNACYYGLVAEAYRSARELTPEIIFEEFDDAFLRELAGIKPDEPLPLKSNEVFDEEYRSQLERWYYLPDTSCPSIYDGVMSFMEQVRSGKLEPYAGYYERVYPNSMRQAKNIMDKIARELLIIIIDNKEASGDIKTKIKKLAERLHRMLLDEVENNSIEILWVSGKTYKFTAYSGGDRLTVVCLGGKRSEQTIWPN